MNEDLSLWAWVARDLAKKLKPVTFEARTYVEARAIGVKRLKLAEELIEVRVVYEWEIAAMRARKVAA